MSLRFRSRRGNQLRPINRIKHVVDSQFSANAGTTTQTTIIKAVENPALNAVTEVNFGSSVNGIYLRVEVYGTSAAALANVYLAVIKSPGGNLGAIPPNAVGGDDDKRYVIHQEMIMLQRVANSNPRTLFNGVIVIPRGYRRNAPNDLLLLRILAPGVNIDACVQCHYKEFN